MLKLMSMRFRASYPALIPSGGDRYRRSIPLCKFTRNPHGLRETSQGTENGTVIRTFIAAHRRFLLYP